MSKNKWTFGLKALALMLALVSVAAVPAQAVDGPSSSNPGTGPLDPPNPPGPRGGPGWDPLWSVPHLAGEITAVGSGQFTLTAENNIAVSIDVNAMTSYIGSLESFADLEVGLDVVVVGHRGDDGSFVGRVIAARDDLPFGIPLGGEVTAAGDDSLTLEMRKGLTLTFDVTADTDYLSKDNSVSELSDIGNGDHVMVLFVQSASGSLVANVILVGPVPQVDAAN